jgi:predicted permease
MGMELALGRPITQADNQPGAPLVAVLSHRFWMRAFGGDPSMVGAQIRVNGLAAEVVGVTGPAFQGLSKGGFFPETDVTVPLAAHARVYPRWQSFADGPLEAENDTYWLRVMARLSPDVPSQRTEEIFTATFRRQATTANDGDTPPAEVRLLAGARGAQPVPASRARMLYVLLGVVGIVLMVACVNLASLMLARGVSRQREIAVRRALGSGRARLVRQSVMESAILAGAGTIAGLLLAFGTRGALGRLVSSSAGSEAFGRIAAESAIDIRAVLFAGLLGAGATLLFGTLPALRLSNVDPMTWLKHRSAGSGMPKLTAGRVLVSLQIAVSVPLLVGSVLLLRTMSNLSSVELGFDPDGVSVFQLDPSFAQVPTEGHADLYMQVLEQIRQIPGVSSATIMGSALMSGITSNNWVEIDGEQHNIYVNAVGPDYLRTIGMRLIEGRMPGTQDIRGAPRVGVVNERLAREVFGAGSALGQTLTMGSSDYEVIGVVNDSRYRDARSEVPATVFPSALQRTGYGGNHVALRSSVPLGQLEPLVREAVGRVSRDLPVPALRSQLALVEESSGQERMVANLLTTFGLFALLLASIGLHGVVAYSVGRRTSEIGLRVAVGARPGQVQWLMLRQVLVLCGLGLTVGIPAALAAAPLVGSLLYGVTPTDVTTIVASSALLVSIALAAGYLPARRASRVDPLTALRTE